MQCSRYVAGEHVRQWMMLLDKEGASDLCLRINSNFKELPIAFSVWDD